MQSSNPPLPTGYSPLPPGKIANVVTCLEMLERPASPVSAPASVPILTHVERPDPQAYRTLFRRIGTDWLWVSRLEMPDDALGATIRHPAVEVHVLSDGTADIGLVELDFRQDGECEIVYFGLAPEAVGRGLGRSMMDRTLSIAWARPIRRLWLHTCHFDHPGALPFYRRAGFRPYAVFVEVLDDPRLSGILPRAAAPQVPLLG